MKLYKFFLDNIELINDPKGWDEGKIQLKRNDTLNALLYEYVSDLIFIGDGYDYFQTQLTNNGYCDKIEIRIDKICTDGENYYNLFEGIIMLRDIKVDEYLCEVTCNAEDNTLIQQIVDFAENEFRLDGTSGMGWSITAVPVKKLGIWTQARVPAYTLTQQQRNGYLVYDALQFLMNAMTQGDNQVNIVSTYFQTTTTTRYKSTIKFLNTTQLDATFPFSTFIWTNYLGVVQTALPPTNAVPATALLSIANYITNFSSNPIQTFHYSNDFARYQWCDSDGVDTLTIESDFPIPDFTSVYRGSSPNLPISYIKTDTVIGTDGMKSLALTTGAQLRNLSGATAPIISFKKLFDELTKEFNLGCVIENNGGTITFRIEPIEYFFLTNNTSVTLENVPNLKYAITNRFNKDQIKVGDGRNQENLIADFAIENTWYSGTKCTTVKVDCKNEFVIDWDEIDKQLTSTNDNYDEKIYLIECDTGTLGADFDSKLYRMGFAGSTVGSSMNNHLVNYWKIRRWLFSMSGVAKYGNKSIANHNTTKPHKEYIFNFPLSFDQFKLIRANPSYSIVFRKDTNILNNRFGWVEEISYTEKTSMATFKLVTV